MVALSDRIGPDLLRALGIPVELCRRAVVTMAAGEPIIVEAEHYAAEPKDGELQSISTRYSLTAKAWNRPRLQLSPDVPVSPAYRAKFNAWALEFFGEEPIQ